MDKQMMYVGIDVGQDEVWAVVPGAKPRRLPNNVRGIRELGRWTGTQASGRGVHFCLEATGVYGRSVAVRLLAGNYGEVSIVNPAQIAAYARAQLRRTKTDRVDAQVILSFAESQHPKAWTPEPPALRHLIHLMNQADALRQDLRRWLNRQHTEQYVDDLPATVKTSTTRIIQGLRRQLAGLERAINNLVDAVPELHHQVTLLCSIPGIARLSAVRLLAYARNTLTTCSARAVIAHAGLAPRHRESGRSVRGRSHLAKQGDRRLRTALYMPALVGIRWNPSLHAFYQRLIEAGKPRKLALTACMKKLLMICRAVLVNQKPFDPCFST